MRFWLRRPNPKQKRKSYSIVCVHPDGRIIAVPHPRLTEINASRQTLAPDELEGQLQALLRELRNAQPKEYHPDNLQVAERYWQAIRHDRYRVSDAAAREELIRAAEGAGHVLLSVGGRTELQLSYDKYPARKQRRLVGHANRILKFLNRGFVLAKKPEEPTRVSYIPLAALKKKLSLIKDEPLRLAIATAFATGARLGELVSLRYEDNFALILEQVRRDKKKGPTKNKKEREAFVVPELRAYVTAWDNLSQAERLCVHTRHRKLWTLMKSVWGLRPHDLRHCYAIHLAGRSFTLPEIAEQLGIRQDVARKHYLSFMKSSQQKAYLLKRYKSS
jgi:integrase